MSGESTAVEVPNLLNDPVIRRHRVAVDGLEPDTVYRYSLGDGTPRRVGAMANRQDRTGSLARGAVPLPGRRPDRPGALGPAARRRHIAGIPTSISSCSPATWSIAATSEPTGTISSCAPRGSSIACRSCPAWGTTNISTVGLASIVPSSSCRATGPEESMPTWFTTSSAVTPASPCSTARWPSATRARRDGRRSGSTRRCKQTQASWKFVIFHHPVYPSHPWRDTPALREHWVPIFDKHHVDLVLQGHDHAYLRTYPCAAITRRRARPGNDLRDRRLRRQVRRPGSPRLHRSGAKRRIATYQTIDIDAQSNRLTYRAWTEDGRIIDELVIDKRTGRRCVSR